MLVAAWLVASAYAQDTFKLDPVFVSRFQPATPELDAAGERIRGALEKELVRAFLVVDPASVPAFEDYTAEVYLQSCPPNEQIGCSYVVGRRAQAEWVIAGRVQTGEKAGALAVSIDFVNVAESRVVVPFDVQLEPANEAAFVSGVVDALRRIVDGLQSSDEDIRGEVVDTRTKDERAAQERQLVAASLQDLEGELHVMRREAPTGEIEQPRLTASDLAHYAEQDSTTPWAALGMRQSEFLRFKNSGRTLSTWHSLTRGREGAILLELGLGAGSMPFAEAFDGRKALDKTNLTPVQKQEWQEIAMGGGLGTRIGAGLGVMPWLDVGATLTLRGTRYSYLFYQEVEGSPQTVGDPALANMTTVELGGHATLVPLPTSAVRPTARVGVSAWKGKAIDQIAVLPTDYETLPAPHLLLVDVAPGVEVNAGRTLRLFADGMLAAVVAGDRVQTLDSGPAVLGNATAPTDPPALGFEVAVGVRTQLGPLWRRDTQAAIPEEELE